MSDPFHTGFDAIPHPSTVDVPHFSFPFHLHPGAKTPCVVAQDSDEEIIHCVQVLTGTVIGERIEAPEYGMPDSAFRQNGVDLDSATEAILQWEPRAEISLAREYFDDLVDRVRVSVRSGIHD